MATLVDEKTEMDDPVKEDSPEKVLLNINWPEAMQQVGDDKEF